MTPRWRYHLALVLAVASMLSAMSTSLPGWAFLALLGVAAIAARFSVAAADVLDGDDLTEWEPAPARLLETAEKSTLVEYEWHLDPDELA